MMTQVHTFFDTDLHIHRLSPDPAVQKAAQTEFDTSHPTAMSAFSLVELKGNYISCLILLHRKVSNSASLKEAYSRVSNSGGRRSALMLAQLINYLGGTNFPINPWNEARSYILTHLDAQIEASWDEFRKSVDLIANDFNCTRAREEPRDDGKQWVATIARCRQGNTNCKIVKFMKQYMGELKQLIDYLNRLDVGDVSSELNRIKELSEITINTEKFPWIGTNCRKVGDLLIGLQSKSGMELLSSNYKEHGKMHKPLGYNFRRFPVAEIRLK